MSLQLNRRGHSLYHILINLIKLKMKLNMSKKNVLKSFIVFFFKSMLKFLLNSRKKGRLSFASKGHDQLATQ